MTDLSAPHSEILTQRRYQLSWRSKMKKGGLNKVGGSFFNPDWCPAGNSCSFHTVMVFTEQ